MWPTKKTCQDVCDIMWPHLNAPSGHFTRMTLAIHIRQKWMSDGRWVKPLSFKIHQIIIYWLVVWNMTFMTFHILGVIIPTDFHIFQRGRYTTNRYIHIYIYISIHWLYPLIICFPPSWSTRGFLGILPPNVAGAFRSSSRPSVRHGEETVDAEMGRSMGYAKNNRHL